jgi:hypothetical protein
MNNLPRETVCEIITNLDVDSLRNLYVTSKHFSFLDRYHTILVYTQSVNASTIVIRRTDMHGIVCSAAYIATDYILVNTLDTIIMINKKFHIAQINNTVYRTKKAYTDYNNLRGIITQLYRTTPTIIDKDTTIICPDINICVSNPYVNIPRLSVNPDWFESPLHTAVAYKYQLIVYNAATQKFHTDCPDGVFMSYYITVDYIHLYPSIDILSTRHADVYQLLLTTVNDMQTIDVSTVLHL